jgi:hypothetical protein
VKIADPDHSSLPHYQKGLVQVFVFVQRARTQEKVTKATQSEGRNHVYETIYVIIMGIVALITTLSLRMYNRSNQKPVRWLWLGGTIALGLLFLWLLIGAFFASPEEP